LPGIVGRCKSAVIPERLTEVVCDADELEVNVSEAGLNVTDGIKPEVEMVEALNVTVPVKPLLGATAMVTEGMVPPAATVVLALLPLIVNAGPLGVSEKSGQLLEVTVTISGVVFTEPFDEIVAPPESPAPPAGSAGPLEPA
jgi:hypothetical protein